MATPASASVGTTSTASNLHHIAYKCRSSEETRHFYEDILGMPLVNVMEVRDLVSTTGELVDFIHLFFQMRDGSCIAFFDLGDGRAPHLDADTPAFTVHVALDIESQQRLESLKARIEGYGVTVTGPIDQEEYVRSIYVTDPNGVRLEFTFEIGNGLHSEDIAEHDRVNRAILERWSAEHANKL